MSETINVKLDVEIPDVPQFLWTNHEPIPLCALTEGAIREIAVEWTTELIKSWHDQNQNKEEAYALAKAEHAEFLKYDLQEKSNETP